MQTNPKFLDNIYSYIDVLTMDASLKKTDRFWKINSFCKLNLNMNNSLGLVAR